MYSYWKGVGMAMGVPVESDARLAKIPLWARARRYTDEALSVIVGVMRDGEAPPSVRQSAAQVILDRGWGKAPQVIAVSEADAAMRVDVSALPADVRASMESALRLALANALVPEPTTPIVEHAPLRQSAEHTQAVADADAQASGDARHGDGEGHAGDGLGGGT